MKLFQDLLMILMLASFLTGNDLSAASGPNEKPDKSILILESDKDPQSAAFASHLRTNIQLRNQSYDVLIADIETPNLSLNHSLLIAIGKEAFRFAHLESSSPPVLALLLTEAEYRDVASIALNQATKSESAIFHQSPLVRQLLLFQEIYPPGKRIGFLISPNEQASIEQLKTFAFKLNLILEYEVIEDSKNFAHQLLRLINRTDSIIATNNNQIYNRSTIKSILLTLYRHNKFLIGFNQHLVKAGGVATTYTSMQQYMDEVSDEINHFYRNDMLFRAPHASQRFSIDINEKVAHSLNLSIKNESHYVDVIQARELSLGESQNE